MKKLTILFTACLICSSLNANPIMVPLPPIINEIYFDTNQNWTIELNTLYWDNLDFNYITIETSSGSSGFIPGIIPTDSVTLINQSNLITPLFIDPNGDYIKFFGIDNYIKSEFYFYFGNIQYSYISPLNDAQSYVTKVYDGYMAHFYYLIKETNPSIGCFNNPYPVPGIFTGQIVDHDSIPLTDVKIDCKVTSYNYETHPIYDPFTYGHNLYYDLQIHADAGGNFYNNALFARDYDLMFYSKDGNYQYDTTIRISIEPDSINYFNFVLDTTRIYVGINQPWLPDCKINVYPNPVFDNTTISFDIGNDILGKNAIIKIFTSSGNLIKIIPIPNNRITSESNIRFDFSKFAAGNYYCNLEIDGFKVASNKIVVIR